MATPLYSTFEKRIDDAVERLLRMQVDPWFFLNSEHSLKVATFDGRTISYQGIGFEGSPRHVFWSRYIEPFLEDLAIQQIAAATAEARTRRVDGAALLKEVQGLLFSASRKVFERMAEVDQRLLGEGFPQSVPLRPVDDEHASLNQFIDRHVAAELAMWKPTRWYEDWYERNKFWVWMLGTLIAIASLIGKFL